MSQRCSELEKMAASLLEKTDGLVKILDLSTALLNQGKLDASIQLEKMLLEQNSAKAKHHWRMIQNARAPANQFLLLNNEHRTAAFNEAFRTKISRGTTVLEIGTGSGILAMLAAKAGACRVFTCEHQGLMADIASKIIYDNGLQGVVEVIAKSANELVLGQDLPDKVDVIVCDVFTGSLLEAGGLGLIAAAAESFLKAGGCIIPGKGAIKGCLVGGAELESLCRSTTASDLDLSRFNLFSPVKVPIHCDQFHRLNYKTLSSTFTCFNFEIGAMESTCPRNRIVQIEAVEGGNIAGLLQWTDLELAPGISLDAAPEKTIRWPRFLHVFPEPISIKKAQEISLSLSHNSKQFSVWPT